MGESRGEVGEQGDGNRRERVGKEEEEEKEGRGN